MTWNLSWNRSVVRTLLLLAALGAVLGYRYVPKPSAKVSDPIDQQLSSLRRGTDLERSAAVTELARMVEKDSGRIIPALIGAAADREALVRCAGVDSLHVVKPSDPAAPEAMSALFQALRDPDPRVRAKAAGVLSTFRP